MALRDYLQKLEDNHNLLKISPPISKTYEIAAVLKQLEPAPVLFESVREVAFPRGGEPVLQQGRFCRLFRPAGLADHPAADPGDRKPLALPGGRAGSLPGGGRPAARPGQRCPSCATAKKTAATTSPPAW